jgi:hypothetical protein
MEFASKNMTQPVTISEKRLAAVSWVGKRSCAGFEGGSAPFRVGESELMRASCKEVSVVMAGRRAAVASITLPLPSLTPGRRERGDGSQKRSLLARSLQIYI